MNPAEYSIHDFSQLNYSVLSTPAAQSSDYRAVYF